LTGEQQARKTADRRKEKQEGAYMARYQWLQRVKSPLHEAAINGDIASAKKLLDQGTPVDSVTSIKDNEVTPLHCATRFDEEKMVRMLLENGAAVNQPDSNGSTALHWAAKQGWVEEADILLAKGANLEAKDKHEHTPIYNAVLWGEKAMFDFLVTKGADIQVVSDCNEVLLHEAVQREDSDDDDYTGIVKALLDKGMDVNVRNCHNETPLHKAISFHPNEKMVRLLLERGADINAISEEPLFKGTILQLAFGHDYRDLIPILMEYGPDVNRGDADGNTILHKIGNERDLA